jgi:hypothetical protein
MLCKEPTFWQVLATRTGRIVDTEDGARNALCEHLQIHSRSDLSDNTQAQVRFSTLLDLHRRAVNA